MWVALQKGKAPDSDGSDRMSTVSSELSTLVFVLSQSIFVLITFTCNFTCGTKRVCVCDVGADVDA